MKRVFFACLALILSTSAKAADTAAKTTVSDRSLVQVRLILNWVPEPEFGGFYAAQTSGAYEKNGLRVEIIPGGAGTPTVQMLASGKTEFAVTSGSEVAIAQSRGANVIAVYSVFETSPMGIMVHKSRKLKGLSDLFSQEGIVALEQGQAYVSYLKKKFDPIKAKFVPYTGGVSNFLHDPQFAQQGYIFSEPLTAKAQGADPDFFLLASAGYNPYSAVVAVRADYLKQNEALVKSMVTAIRDGWASYRKSPQEANQKMALLNKAMDLATFAAAAKEQERLLGDGSMSESRWKEHIQQLLDAKALTKAPDAQACFRNF